MTDKAVLSAIESELVRVEAFVAELRRRVHALHDQPVADKVTPPAEAIPSLPAYLTRSGAIHPRGYWFRGTFTRCRTYKEIYLGLLTALAHESPDNLQRAADDLIPIGHSRRYLAPTPTQLFGHKPESWAHEHSAKVTDGWYADINLRLSTMQSLMQVILRAARLKPGTDVVIFWDSTPVRPDHSTTAATTH